MDLRAGASSRDISPSGSVFLVGYPHVERMSTGVHDPLLVSTLLLRDHGRACAITSLDLLFISPATARELRRSIGGRLRIPEEAVLVGCTHTHSGPVTNRMLAWREDPVVPAPDPDYMARLADAVLQSAEEAEAALEPAEIASAVAPTVGVGGNRLDPAGPADPEAGILLLRGRADERPIAVVLCYAMHPTVLHEDSTMVSADFPGAARRLIGARIREGLPVVYLTGPAGNQSPRHFVSATTFGEAERLGTLLGESVLRAISDLPPEAFSRTVDLGGAMRAVSLPLRRFPPAGEAERMLSDCRLRFESLRTAGAPRAEVRTAECAVFGAEEMAALARAQASGELERWMASYLPATVQLLRIGSTRLYGLPGELFVEYGLELKGRAGGRVMVASLVNGDLQGYIVTPEAVRAGTYEARISMFDPGAGTTLVEAALELARP